MNIALDLFHQLPPWARNLAASFRGYSLSRRRYDEKTDLLVEKALERDYWTDSEWVNWQGRRLEDLLSRAADNVPFYRDYWSNVVTDQKLAPWSKLANWPVLEKPTVRDVPRSLVADDRRISEMIHENTSGTTGASLDLWTSQETVKDWYALFEARCRVWYGVSRHDPWGILGGQLVAPFRQKRPPFWVWNSGLNQLYMSAYHLSPKNIRYYLDAISERRIKYVLGYTSAIYALAVESKRLNYPNLGLKVAITNAEPVYDYQRAAIEEAFQCPVRETYGMAEIAAAASECEKGNLHIWPDAGIIETDLESIDESGSADLLCTGLINSDMPLIRYRVGDRGTISNGSCECGRTLPLLESIDGRTDDVLYTSDGRPCSHVHLAQGGDLHLYESQIIQESLNRLRVKYVPKTEFTEATKQKFEQNITNRMGNIEVVFETVEKVPRTSRGKLRAVICQLTPEEIAELRK